MMLIKPPGYLIFDKTRTEIQLTVFCIAEMSSLKLINAF